MFPARSQIAIEILRQIKLVPREQNLRHWRVRNAKLPVDTSTSALVLRVIPSCITCSQQKRRKAVFGTFKPRNDIPLGALNLERKSLLIATVVRSSVLEERCGMTLRKYVRPPPALAA
jgi:hypothetical protein